MKHTFRTHGVWALAVTSVLLIGLVPSLCGVVSSTGGTLVNLLSTATATLPPVQSVPAGQAISQVVATSATAATAAAAPAATAAFDEQQAANELEAQNIAVYEDASPSVVNITNRSYVYYGFMGSVPEEGTGSGFVYDTQGHIVTNYHVIENAQELLVTLASGTVYSANVVGADPTNDLAVIQIDAGQDLPAALTMGDSNRLRVGQFVVAIGNPYGLQQTLTTGVVSALGRVIQSPQDNSFIGEAIQTDAAINPGNSGGPLLNLQGQVIGVNSQIISPSGASSGIGFAVSANTVHRVVPQLIANGYYAHPWLGTDMVSLTPAISRMLREAGADVSADSGLLVVQVSAGGPADRADIRGGSQWVRIGRSQVPVGGDIITAIDDQPTPDLQALTVYLETKTNVGDTVQVTILRDDQEQTVPVVVGEQPQGQ
jgi:S1-C subfamily serine protease